MQSRFHVFDVNTHYEVRTEQNRHFICKDLYIYTSSYKKLIQPYTRAIVKWRATLLYITSFSINLLVQINNISIHIMIQRINNFPTIRTGITHTSTHTYCYYSMPDVAETTITTTIQLVILNLNGFSYISKNM